MIISLYEELQEYIDPIANRCNAVAGIDRLFYALWYYATGTFQRVVGDSSGVDRSTISRIITRVTDAIYRRGEDYITSQ